MKRSPQIRLFQEELVLDCFAGGGGASTGIEMAIGRSPDIAINHDREALALHEANHPETRHIRSNIRRVSFKRVCAGRQVGLAWFSPDCTYHSKARGGKPYRPRDRARRIRGLAWEAVRCAVEVRPRVICIENVEEFRDWCPLTKDGRPDPDKRGQTFERWKSRFRNLGYTMEFREERASTKGAPTIRKRLFGVLRCDGQPIAWEKATHGPGTSRPFRTAAECIDFSLPVPSIFLTPAEAKTWGRLHGIPTPRRPLASNSLRRVARGTMRFVVNNPKPFIVRYNGGDRTPLCQPTDEPITTLDTSNRFGLVAPVITPLTHTGSDRAYSAVEPLRTITTAKRGEFALIAPILAGVAGRKGQSPETTVDRPYHTVTTKGDTALVTAFLKKHNGGHEATGQLLDRPVDTVVSRDNKALVASHLIKLRGGLADHPNSAQNVQDPAPTLTAGGTHVAEIRTTLAPLDADAIHEQYPKAHLVAAFLLKFYGTKKDGVRLDVPLHTVTTKDRYALVTVTVDGATFVIVDIGMRMLTPRELFLCQGFPPSYVIDIQLRVRVKRGRKYQIQTKSLTKGAQVRLCGNSVCPPHAASIVRANYRDPMRREAVA